MNRVEPDDLNGVGMALGAAVAGSPKATRTLMSSLAEEEKNQLVGALLSEWASVETFSQLLEGIKVVADEFKRLSGELPG
jgi:hypothetical protein